MGEFRLHHVKFFEYLPSAIQCFAYDETRKLLAVGRVDASVEIWNPEERWYQERVIPGSEKRRIDALVWARGRLFSAGLQGDIVEYDVKKQAPKKSTYYGNGFWCMACNHAETYLATGSEDGCVRLYEIGEEGVTFERPLDNQEGRIVSLAWHHTDEVIVTGSVDNIRVWNVTTGHAIQRISVQRSPVAPTIVWSVAVTKDMAIISGDSSGRTQFWNGKMGTLLRSFASHRADVQAVCVTSDGMTAFSSGVHSLIAKFELVDKDRSGTNKIWVPSRAKVGGNDHTHDVKALTVAGDFLVSGGVDTNLVINSSALVPQTHNLKGKDAYLRYRRKIISFPQRNLVCCASKAKLLVLQYPTYLEVWRLGSTQAVSGNNGDQLPLAEKPIKILQLKIKGSDHIVCSAISRCGTWLAYSDVDKVRLYNLILSSDNSALSPSVNKVPIMPTSLKPAHHMTFTSDNRLVLASQDCSVQVLAMDSVQPTMLHSFPPQADSINLLSVSKDGGFISATDLAGETHVYNMNKRKTVGKLPGYKRRVTAMNFDPKMASLMIAYSDRTLKEFSASTLSYTPWSRTVYKSGLHPAWLSRRDLIGQLTFNPQNSDQFLVQDQQSFTIIDKAKPLPRPHQKLYKESLGSSPSPKKRKTDKEEQHSFSICQKFKPLLFAGCLEDPGWILIVERPKQSILESLPPSLQQKKFGT
ncbi:U3 small nucleolar RNA-associated protein 4 homolog [Amphiura filiformis]|uniref:U3 small nucleolar RNA-associated protein 4 homolog n=1 Tax=Amphiura filiformis TaxID=82378 RepID=UPI003B21E663